MARHVMKRRTLRQRLRDLVGDALIGSQGALAKAVVVAVISLAPSVQNADAGHSWVLRGAV